MSSAEAQAEDTAEGGTYDVVVVGGGSAGAVLANRLSADPARTVLLLEAGENYLPDAYPGVLLNPSRTGDETGHDWGYQASVGSLDRTVEVPRGKVLGGNSAVNGAVALRARPDDFAAWAAHGLAGWSFGEVLETYRELENTPTGAEAFHGRTGPFPVRQSAYEELTPSLQAFVDAAERQGLNRVEDMNGDRQDGVSPALLAVVSQVRCNTAHAYLTEEVRLRPNLTVHGRSEVDRLLLDGVTVTGVVTVDGTVHRAAEVILSAGVFGSAAILLRSGIGPAEDSRRLGIEVVADLPVGRRLKVRPRYDTVYALRPEAGGMFPASGAIVWTASSEAAPDELDLQIAATHLFDPTASPTGGAIVLTASVVRPESTGTVRLADADPKVAPVIDCNLLATPRDRRRMLEAVRLSRTIGADDAFAAVSSSELAPGDEVRDDEALERAVEEGLTVCTHPTSTVPMGGEDDDGAVVDGTGAVRGITGLRVVDASVFPEAPSAPADLTTVMVAEHICKRALSR